VRSVGETKTKILQTAGKRSDPRSQNVFDALVNEGLLVRCEVKKGIATYEGFRLTAEDDKAAPSNTAT